LLVGSLLWSSSADAADVLDHMRDDDLADPALAAVLAALRRLVDAGRSHGPQLVLDELRRSGTVSTSVAEQLKAATISGADPFAARHYAAATVADSLRRRVESVGAALVSAAEDAAEADLSPLIAQGAASVADCAHRLKLLRGEPI
jgi:replicative DNA helicase